MLEILESVSEALRLSKTEISQNEKQKRQKFAGKSKKKFRKDLNDSEQSVRLSNRLKDKRRSR